MAYRPHIVTGTRLGGEARYGVGHDERTSTMATCEDAPCCGCCGPAAWDAEARSAEEAAWDQDDWYDDGWGDDGEDADDDDGEDGADGGEDAYLDSYMEDHLSGLYV